MGALDSTPLESASSQECTPFVRHSRENFLFGTVHVGSAVRTIQLRSAQRTLHEGRRELFEFQNRSFNAVGGDLSAHGLAAFFHGRIE
jgi:hypothetical protein